MSDVDQQAIYPGAELFLLRQFMRSRGIAAGQALLGSGLAEEQLRHAGTLVASEQFDRIYRNLYRLDEQAGTGLSLGQALNLSRWGLISAALQSSKTLGDALATANQMRVLLRSRFTLGVVRDGAHYAISVRKRDGMDYPVNPQFAHEMLLASLQVQIRQLLGREFRFAAIHLSYPAPAYERTYQQTFACPLTFAAADSGFRIAADDMHQPLPLANPAVKQQAMAVAAAELQRVEQVLKGDCGFQVRAVLQSQPGRLALDDVAAALNLSSRTLRRKLQDSGLTFRQLQDEESLKQALALLDDPRHKVSSVADGCGFRDLASFRDAFRRWTGMTPQEYRRRLR